MGGSQGSMTLGKRRKGMDRRLQIGRGGAGRMQDGPENDGRQTGRKAGRQVAGKGGMTPSSASAMHRDGACRRGGREEGGGDL